MLLNYATKTSALQRNGWRIAARAYSVDSPKEEATTSVAKRRGLGGVTMEEYEKIVAAREKHAPNKDGFREMKVDNQSIQWRFQHEHRKKRGMTKDHAYVSWFFFKYKTGAQKCSFHKMTLLSHFVDAAFFSNALNEHPLRGHSLILDILSDHRCSLTSNLHGIILGFEFLGKLNFRLFARLLQDKSAPKVCLSKLLVDCQKLENVLTSKKPIVKVHIVIVPITAQMRCILK